LLGPFAGGEVPVHRYGRAVFRGDLVVVAAEGGTAPPVLVDAPGAAGGAHVRPNAVQAQAQRRAVRRGLHLDGAGGLQASDSTSICRSSGMTDHGSTSTQR